MNIRDAIISAWKESPYHSSDNPDSDNISYILKLAADNCPLLDGMHAMHLANYRNAACVVKLYISEKALIEVPITITAGLLEIMECIAFDLTSNQEALFTIDTYPEQLRLFGEDTETSSSVEQYVVREKRQHTMSDDDIKRPRAGISVVFYDKKVHVSTIAWTKLFSVVDYYTAKGLEVAFYGYIRDDGSHLTLYDVDVPIQTVRPTTYDIPASAIFDMPDARNINCMIHSHANMGVFYSGTDQVEFDKECGLCGVNRIYASIVINKRREWFGKIFNGDTKEVARLKFVKPTFEENPFVVSVKSRVNTGGI